jgi:hypothetical protein
MRFSLLAAAGVGAVLVALPAYAQTETQVGRVVEAIRQASKPDKPNPGLYSDWQLKPETISRWSKPCLQRNISPEEFQVNRRASRQLVTCMVRDVLKQELKTSKNDESLAVQRVAAWWLTGDGDRYNNQEASPYVQRVLGFYQSGGAIAAKPIKPATAAKPATKPPAQPAIVVPTKPGQSPSFYDRYMQAGQVAVEKQDSAIAALYFRRALDERPKDRLALQALRNVEASRPTPRPNPAAKDPLTPER